MAFELALAGEFGGEVVEFFDGALSEPRLLLIGASFSGVFGECSEVLVGLALPAVLTDEVIFLRADGGEFGAVVVKVGVILAGVEGEVSGITHEFGNGLDSFGEVKAKVFRNDSKFAGRAILVGAGGRFVNAGDDGRAADETDGSGHEGALEKDAIGGKIFASDHRVLRCRGHAHPCGVAREISRREPASLIGEFVAVCPLPALPVDGVPSPKF